MMIVLNKERKITINGEIDEKPFLWNVWVRERDRERGLLVMNNSKPRESHSFQIPIGHFASFQFITINLWSFVWLLFVENRILKNNIFLFYISKLSQFQKISNFSFLEANLDRTCNYFQIKKKNLWRKIFDLSRCVFIKNL